MFTGQEVDRETENQNQVKEKGIFRTWKFLEITMCLYSDSGFHTSVVGYVRAQALVVQKDENQLYW